MKNILFLCTGNSCRSQMAEGWGKQLKSQLYNFYSAGTKTHGMNPLAVEVMGEAGVDLSNHWSKTVDDLLSKSPDLMFDYIITVCSDADENCPTFSSGKIIHMGFDDPPRLTKDEADKEKALIVYRRVRDEIKAFVEKIESYLI